jgi:hypothetical protein
MKIRARVIAVGLLVPAAIVMAVGTSGAATRPPVRKFEAHYRGSFALVIHRVPVIGSTKPISSARGSLSASVQQLWLVGQGWAATLGQSRLSGMVTVGQGSLCQPINGWVALSTTRSPIVGIRAPVRVWLAGVLCSPLEGTAKTISGRYHESGLAGGGGSFAGRAYGTAAGRLVLYFKGSI